MKGADLVYLQRHQERDHHTYEQLENCKSLPSMASKSDPHLQ